MQVFIYCKITLYVSGVYRTHHQEYIKLQLQLMTLRPVPEAEVTVLCTPDGECDTHPKHTE